MQEEKRKWWAEAYDQMQKVGYDYHYIDFESAIGEVDFMEEVLDLSSEDKILDLGCGNGRHSILLAESGYEVVGIDYSTKMLELAKEEAKQRAIKVEFQHQDMLKLDQKEEYNAIIIMDGSFGIFSDQENEEVIGRVSKALKRGGRLLLQTHSPYYIAMNQGVSYEIDEDKRFIRETSFDVYKGAVVDKIICINEVTGEEQRIPTRYYRAYTVPELKSIFEKYGLKEIDIFGHNQEFCPTTSKSFNLEEDMVMYITAKKK
ncbi:class I SAM-dependent methyltransferase [Orenia marismortui]|uniref:Methyltransferase family protein n=1 Tax=Orenia marismortui TaxID=46469 RepID=A0A4R8GSH6_9FIRM|nr:class I SAM-dependent methyltransferase [Orenia marismortui]TDX45511.1 methyltransferase family protein [Orenia marismortui]